MNSALNSVLPATFPANSSFIGGVRREIQTDGIGSTLRMCYFSPSASLKLCQDDDYEYCIGTFKGESCLKRDMNRQRRSLVSMFCYDKPIPAERIEKPVRLYISEKEIGDNQRCSCCEAKGAVLCATCTGTGLYVDSILESQGIIVKVRCLGCGGTGNTMCTDCGGRGHIGH